MGFQAFHEVGLNSGPFFWYLAAAMLLVIPFAWCRKGKFVPLSVSPALVTACIAALRIPLPFSTVLFILPVMLIVVVASDVAVATMDAKTRTMIPFIPCLIPLMITPMITMTGGHHQDLFLDDKEIVYSNGAVGQTGRMDRNKVQVIYRKAGNSPKFWLVEDGGKHEFLLSDDTTFGYVLPINGGDVAKSIAKWAGVTPQPDSSSP